RDRHVARRAVGRDGELEIDPAFEVTRERTLRVDRGDVLDDRELRGRQRPRGFHRREAVRDRIAGGGDAVRVDAEQLRFVDPSARGGRVERRERLLGPRKERARERRLRRGRALVVRVERDEPCREVLRAAVERRQQPVLGERRFERRERLRERIRPRLATRGL